MTLKTYDALLDVVEEIAMVMINRFIEGLKTRYSLNWNFLSKEQYNKQGVEI